MDIDPIETYTSTWHGLVKVFCGKKLMGLNAHAARFLLEERANGTKFGAVATIGRLDLRPSRSELKNLAAKYAPDVSIQGRPEEYEHAERFLFDLGAESVSAIDNSDFEGASVIFDLNEKMPIEYNQLFDFVFDGGTLEHIFDIKTAIANEMSLVKVGGHLAIQTMANNFFGHGFYQISAEFFFRALSEENGFKIKRVLVHERPDFSAAYEVSDPAEVGHRVHLSNDRIGVKIFVLAQRVSERPIFEKAPQQSDYTRAWRRDDDEDVKAADASHPAQRKPAASTFRKRVLAAAPWLRQLKRTVKTRSPWLLLMPLVRPFPRLANALLRKQEYKSFGLRRPSAQPDDFRRLD